VLAADLREPAEGDDVDEDRTAVFAVLAASARYRETQVSHGCTAVGGLPSIGAEMRAFG